MFLASIGSLEQPHMKCYLQSEGRLLYLQHQLELLDVVGIVV